MWLRVLAGMALPFVAWAELLCGQLQQPATVRPEPAAAPAARFDLRAASSGLEFAGLAPPLGSVDRMDWVPVSERDRTWTVNVPLSGLAPSGFEFHFLPDGNDDVEVELRGPWQPGEDGGLQPLMVEWLEARAEGAALSGFRPGPAWHDQPIRCRLQVRSGVPVVLKLRADVPETLRPRVVGRPADDTAGFSLARQFRKGVSLGNFLEVPPGEDWGGPQITAEDYQAMRTAGFDHVRIPAGWHHYCGPAPRFEISLTYAQRVFDQIDAAQAAGLAVIVNVHHFDRFTEDPERERKKLLAIWQQVAEWSAERPLSVAFEILNEPHGAATTEWMSGFYAEVIPLIRRTNPERAIFVGPGNWNQVAELGALRLPADDRLIVTLHSYTPHFFTHQGAEWSEDCSALRGIEFPGPPAEPAVIPAGAPRSVQDWLERYNRLPGGANPASVAALEAELQWAADWGRYWNRPLHLGEFGVIDGADAASRARYAQAVREICEAHSIGWCWWDWNARFRFQDPARATACPGMVEALLPSSRDRARE